MQGMFSQTFVDIDLSKWNTARVQNMHDMFCLSSVQGDFSSWNTSKVKNMNGMFSHARATRIFLPGMYPVLITLPRCFYLRKQQLI